ncbi:MAG: hypothetical protein E7547_10275 [Ruminococcaceae bacterium]|nr:hypothetical protein [Oscillospiraceae bacterium]
MEIIKRIEKLKIEFSENTITRKNGTILLEPNTIPNCRHMLFIPLTQEYANNFLIDEYKNNFPDEYLRFLFYTNGANLFNVKLNIQGFGIAHPLLVVFGLPLTPPLSRTQDAEEPFDLRIEDLARHKDIPDTWIKCGTYTKDYNFDIQNDIFIDTTSNHVFSCPKNQKNIINNWSSLDDCLCDIFDSFSDCKFEY